MKFKNPNEYWRQNRDLEGELHAVGCLSAIAAMVVLVAGGFICLFIGYLVN